MTRYTEQKIKRISLIVIVILAVIFLAFYIYTLNFYKASEDALMELNQREEFISQDANITVFHPNPKISLKNTGVIFYPGGKVEDTAYVPFLSRLAQQGVTCILIDMPFNLAVFDIDAADEIYSKFNDIEDWYLAGHSLGGAMASSYADKNSDKLCGLILFGAYPIDNSPIDTLTIYGTEDIMLDTSKIDSSDTVVKIQGANHANIGNYGAQKGDGVASISREEQQDIIVENIIDFIEEK